MAKKTTAPAPAEPLLIETWPIERPIPYKNNARTLSDRAVDTLAESIREFGWRQPLVADVDDVIIVGHTRLLAAQKLGLESVPVHVATSLTPAQVKAYRLMDNRAADETSWDLDKLEAEMGELRDLGVDLALTGFNVDELDEFNRVPPQQDEDAAPNPPAEPTTVTGDMWKLGQHIVLCGDALDDTAIQRLVGDKKADLGFGAPPIEDGPTAEELIEDGRADLVFTDPPYNVDYEGYTKEKLKIQGDKMTASEFETFLRGTFDSYRKAVKPTASLYVCHASLFQREFQDAIEAAGFNVRCQVIWAKNTFGWGFGRYKFQHEPIFYAHVVGQKDAWYGDKSQSTLWKANKPSANRLHPTMKPIELIERAIENSSKPKHVVLDLFGGSGSTLIACEKTGRKARLMELDPKYADVIVERWQAYTGLTATLEGDGRTFAEIAQERKKPAA